MSENNIDKIAQIKAQQMLKAPDKETLERLVTKSLGVLQTQGVYALMLFLFSRTSKENDIAPYIRKYLYETILELPEFKDEESLKKFCESDRNHEEVVKWFTGKITDELNTIFLIRDLFERTLIYARFHAKAAQKLTQQNSTEE